MVEDPASYPSAPPPAVEVEVHQFIRGEDDETADAAVVPDPRLVLGELLPEPEAMLLGRVQHREEGERSEGAVVQLGDRVDVLAGRAADHPVRYVCGSIGIDPSATPLLTRTVSCAR